MASDGEDRAWLYSRLLQCFTEADQNQDGCISPEEFDAMCEKSAALPRKFGLAPSADSLYGSVEERQKGRAVMFRSIDDNRDGQISLEEWLDFCYNHIRQKIQNL